MVSKNELENVLDWMIKEIVKLGSQNETTTIIPNLEVVDDSPSGLPSNYIIVVDPQGFYQPAVLAGISVSIGDYVNVVSIRGTEYIAFQQGSASPSTNGGIWNLEGGSGPDIYYDNGNVGIGTDTVSYPLHIFDNQAAALPTVIEQTNPDPLAIPELRLLASDDSAGQFSHWLKAYSGYDATAWNSIVRGGYAELGTDGYGLIIKTENNYPLRIGTNDILRMSILGNGNVGIGVTSPSTALEVSGIASFSEYISHAGDTDTNMRYQDDRWSLTVGNVVMIDAQETTQDVLLLGDTAGTGDVDINFNDRQMFIQGSDGYVGIGSGSNTPSRLLEVAGNDGTNTFPGPSIKIGNISAAALGRLSSLLFGYPGGTTTSFHVGAGITSSYANYNTTYGVGHDLQFRTKYASNSETDPQIRMIIDYQGRIMMGELTAPSSSSWLSIKKTLTSTSDKHRTAEYAFNNLGSGGVTGSLISTYDQYYMTGTGGGTGTWYANIVDIFANQTGTAMNLVVGHRIWLRGNVAGAGISGEARIVETRTRLEGPSVSGTVYHFLVESPSLFAGSTVGTAVAFQANQMNTSGVTTGYAFFDSSTTNLNVFRGSIQVGSPTGGSKGSGTINTQGDIYKNNSAYTNPDFVLEHYYQGKIIKFADSPGASEYEGVLPLDNLDKFLKENLHLPNRRKGPMGIFERGDHAQMWLEELAIYITQLHDRIRELENA